MIRNALYKNYVIEVSNIRAYTRTQLHDIKVKTNRYLNRLGQEAAASATEKKFIYDKTLFSYLNKARGREYSDNILL